jgi:hypothetical protein
MDLQDASSDAERMTETTLASLSLKLIDHGRS